MPNLTLSGACFLSGKASAPLSCGSAGSNSLKLRLATCPVAPFSFTLPKRRRHASTVLSAASDGGPVERYAVVGAGFAGLATCWHLLSTARKGASVAVDLFDTVGLGAGGSGAAAGLLHPYTPRGKLLWKGVEGVEAAMELVKVAEQHAEPGSPDFVWRCGLLRPAKSVKQAGDFDKFCAVEERERRWGCAEAIDVLRARELVPGLSLRELAEDEHKGEEELRPDSTAGLHVPGGLVLHSKRYLSALWRACQQKATDVGGGGQARLHNDRICSLSDLKERGNYSAVVIATGAATGAIKELGEAALPLHLSQGYTLDLAPKEGQPLYPSTSPSLLGGVYMSIQEGGRAAVVGATRQYGFTAQQSLAELGRPVTDEEEVHAAIGELLPVAASTWPALDTWQVKSVRTGVRALPPRTPYGSIPLAGRLSGLKVTSGDSPPPCWVLVGLGARGLVYHALLGKWVADAVRANDASLLPRAVRSWQTDNSVPPPNVDY